MTRGVRAALFATAVLVIVVATGVLALRHAGPLGSQATCTAKVGRHTVVLSARQAENASLIAAIGVRRGLPARAVSIALAAAYQESDITNLRAGDRDSVGIFQQRPSQGWGTRAEILDPTYATNAFYDALAGVDGYSSMRITDAAQRVQRSGYPEAYQAHAADARVLASALTGWSHSSFTCTVPNDAGAGPTPLTSSGLTARADAVRRDLESTFGTLALGGFAPGGVSTGHMAGSAHYEGRAVDVFVRPVDAADKRRGWAIASYLVAQAERLKIATVIFDARIWTAARSSDGWRTYTAPDRPGDRAILEHRDHVHVDVD